VLKEVELKKTKIKKYGRYTKNKCMDKKQRTMTKKGKKRKEKKNRKRRKIKKNRSSS